MKAGVQGLVVCATTGEGATLTPDERRLVIDTAVKRAGDALDIIVGTSQVATWSVMEAIAMAADLGARGMLIAAPPYVKASQDGMYSHFATIADQSRIPVVLYNVPSRTACDLKPETVARLSSHERIVAIKEATGSVERAQRIIGSVSGNLAILSGDDPSTLSILVAGGKGVISTGANVTPDKWVTLWNHWRAGDVMSAAAVQAGLLGLHEALFLESNPGPAKGALQLLGLIDKDIRLPLVWPSRPTLYRLAAEMEGLGMKISGALQ